MMHGGTVQGISAEKAICPDDGKRGRNVCNHPLPGKPQKDVREEKLRLAPEEVLAKAIREMMKR